MADLHHALNFNQDGCPAALVQIEEADLDMGSKKKGGSKSSAADEVSSLVASGFWIEVSSWVASGFWNSAWAASWRSCQHLAMAHKVKSQYAWVGEVRGNEQL
jgi:hypothetical protein